MLTDLTRGRAASSSIWTDAYLAAFARGADLTVASFDHGFRNFPDLQLDLLD